MFIGCNYTVPARQNLPGQSGGGEVVNEAFEIEVVIPADDLVFPLHGNQSNSIYYDYEVDWGDTTSNQYTARTVSHTYSSPGTYKVSITGQWPGAQFQSSSNKINRITKLLNWGRTGLVDLSSMFANSQALTHVTAQDTIQWHPNAYPSVYQCFVNCINLVYANVAGIETDVKPGVYAREMFENCRNLETLNFSNAAFDVGITPSAAYQFAYRVGRDTTDGCAITIQNIKCVRSSGASSPGIHSFFQEAKASSLNCNNWDLTEITSNRINLDLFIYYLNWGSSANKTAYFKNWKWNSNSTIRMGSFAYGSLTEEIDFSGNDEIMYIDYAFQCMYSSQVRKIKGLNKWKAAATGMTGSNAGFQRIFRRARYLTFSPTDPEYNFRDDFIHSGSDADSLYLAFELCGDNAAVANVDSIPNMGNWGMNNIENLQSCFSSADFSDYPVLNWNLSSCTNFRNTWTYGNPKGGSYTKDLDLRNCTFLPNTSTDFMDWYYTFNAAYFANIYFPSNQDFARTSRWERTFRVISNTNMEETHMDTWDYSNIGTGSEHLRLMQGNNNTLSPTFYAAHLARIRATAPTTVNSRFEYNGTRINGGALYTSQQVGGTWVNGSTVINITGIGVGVSVGDILYQSNGSQTARYYYRITAVNSNDEIEIASGLVYTGNSWNILTSQAVKDRQYIVENLAISFTDGVPILT